MNQNIQLPLYVFPDRAKDALMGHFAKVVLIHMTYALLSAGLSMTISNVLTPSTYPGLALYLLAGLAASLLTELMMIGYTSVFMAVSSGLPYGTRNLFLGFSRNANQLLVLAAFFTLIRTIFLLPSHLLPLLGSNAGQDVWGGMVLFLGTILAGNVLYTLCTIPLSLSYLLILDFPGMTAGEALLISMQKMHGQKLRYLKLLLHFIPLQLLCICSFFIGFLWLRPYWLMTKTLFYMDLVKAPKSKL